MAKIVHRRFLGFEIRRFTKYTATPPDQTISQPTDNVKAETDRPDNVCRTDESAEEREIRERMRV